MQTIIGLGKAGCNMADRFKEYPQYKIYKIDTGLEKQARSYALEYQSSPEQYEAHCPRLKQFFKGVRKDESILFITSCGHVSGASLRILEQLKDKCKITILYIKPDESFLSDIKILQNNLLLNVLQEYARSAVFERAYIVDNTKLSDILGDVPIKEYYSRLNEIIVSTFHMVNVFNNSESVVNTFSAAVEPAKISTYGLVNFENGEENLFFNLDTPRKKRYYYAIPEKVLESDGKLMKNVSQQLKDNKDHDKMKMDYGIYTTKYEQPYVYCVADSSKIQKKNT
jgi:hypothetical protein